MRSFFTRRSCTLLFVSGIFVLMNATTSPHFTPQAIACFSNDEGRGDYESKQRALDSITNSKCMHYDGYTVANNEYPCGQRFSAKELQCLSKVPELTTCSACYLCHYYLHHNHSMAAYRSALLSMKHFPRAASTSSCLAVLYLKNNNLFRAAFHASVSYHYNTSLEIHYSALGGSARPVQLQLQDSHRDVLLPDYRAAAAAMKKDHRDSQNPLLATFIEICEKLNGAHTLFAIYSSRLSHLPRNLVGPSVLAHEEFLDEFERSVGPYLSAVGGDASGAWWAHAPQPRPPSEEALRGLAAWPPEKHLILHRQHTASSSAANMFDDHLQGLSNALDRLGVPHKLSSVSYQMQHDDAVTIYFQDFSENVPAAVLGGGGAWFSHRLVQWNLEHPLEASRVSGGACPRVHSALPSCRGSERKPEICRAAVWESSLATLAAAVLPIPLAVTDLPSRRFVPSPSPEHLLLASAAEHRFAAAALAATSMSDFLVERDLDRPIDLLVLGLQSRDLVSLYSSIVSFALERQLVVKFMDRREHTVEEETHLVRDAKVVVSLMAINSDQACAFSAAHLFKLRHLLAMGKVVVSESLASISFDEEVLEEFVQFSPADQLVDVVQALLASPSSRWDLEQRGVQFSVQDNLFASISPALVNEQTVGGESDAQLEKQQQQQPSSLTLLAGALGDLAASLWPATDVAAEVKGAAGNSEEDMSGEEEEEEEEEGGAALRWAETYCRQSSFEVETSTHPILASLSMHNSSHACSNRFRLRILLGYLRRRYHLRGKVLWVGCEKGPEKYRRLGNLHKEFKLSCVFPSPDILRKMLKKFPAHSFELIFVNQEMIEYSFDEFQRVVPLLAKYLHVQRGTVVVNSIAPAAAAAASEAWKLLIYLKTFRDIDSAVGAFDGGVLVFRFRANGFVLHNDTEEIRAISISQQEHRLGSVAPHEHFFHIADRFVPVLDFLHLHWWLSGGRGRDTTYYTSVPLDKICVNASGLSSEWAGRVDDLQSRPYLIC